MHAFAIDVYGPIDLSLGLPVLNSAVQVNFYGPLLSLTNENEMHTVLTGVYCLN